MTSLSIVQVNVTQTVAPAPSKLQQTGAIISQGASTLTTGTRGLLTQVADYTAIMTGAKAISTTTWASSVVTVTAAAPHGFTIGDVIPITIAGTTPTGYNGTFQCTVTTTTAFTYPLVTNPGTATVQGMYTLYDVAEVLSMVTTFFAQGTNLACYILELGESTTTEAVASLTTYIQANPFTIYAFLVPREWDANSAFLSLIASYENTTAKLYFFVTTTTGTYTSYTALMKCVITLIEAPGIPALEFSSASLFWTMLNYAPSSINLVTPFAFSYVSGVTPYPTVGNAALRTTLKAANINIIGQGTEGGISNTLILWGTTMDGHDVTYWYSVDWVQLNLDLDVSNAIINGSNNPQNPLYYDQAGIDRIQIVAQGTMNRGVTFGLVLPPVTVTAVSFATYVVANPSDYPLGIYRGLAVSYTPQRGFTQIIFNVNVTSFPAGG